jgi:hypothetical protein
VAFTCGDDCDLAVWDWRHDVCFDNFTCFTDALMARVAAAAESLKRGAFFITFTKKLLIASFSVLDFKKKIRNVLGRRDSVHPTKAHGSGAPSSVDNAPDSVATVITKIETCNVSLERRRYRRRLEFFTSTLRVMATWRDHVIDPVFLKKIYCMWLLHNWLSELCRSSVRASSGTVLLLDLFILQLCSYILCFPLSHHLSPLLLLLLNLANFRKKTAT